MIVPFSMPDTVNLGPLHLRGDALRLIVSAAIGYGVVRLTLRRSSLPRPVIAELIGTLLLIVLFVWKFGPVLRHPALLWRKPLAALLYGGAYPELVTGVALAFVYLLVHLRRLRLSIKPVADLLAMGATAAIFAGSLLQPQYGRETSLPWGIAYSGDGATYHPLNLYAAIIAVGVLLRLALLRRPVLAGTRFREFAIWWGLGSFIMSLFAVQEPAVHFLSGGQWLAIVTTAGGLLSNPLLTLIDHFILGHTSAGKGWNKMTTNESKEQRKQEQANQSRTPADAPNQEGFDKKLDGPNRPAD